MRTAACVATLALCFTSLPASSQEIVDATDPDKLVSIIRDLGYRAKLEADDVGDPMIRSSVGGTDFSIFFFLCTDNQACKVLMFKVGYDLEVGTTLEAIDDWNENHVFGRAYLDEEGDPWLEMPVNMDGGVSRSNFEDTFDWWEVIVEQFEEHIGFGLAAREPTGATSI